MKSQYLIIFALFFSGCAMLDFEGDPYWDQPGSGYFSNFSDFGNPGGGTLYSSRMPTSRSNDREVKSERSSRLSRSDRSKNDGYQSSRRSWVSRERDDYRRQSPPVPADVRLGMQTQDVRGVWGDPRNVQIAGDSNQGNERWIYTEGPTSRWGFSSVKIIYFEQGQVVGWETTRPDSL